MNVSLISFTVRGGELALRMEHILNAEEGNLVRRFSLAKYAGMSGAIPLEKPLREWCSEHWSTDDLMIFIGASGIAVRTIAPFLKSKKTDPAVLVADEAGEHIISLLSGHIGGANEWTRLLAMRLGADPVITTATDVEGKFAVDEWASRNNLVISSMTLAKEVAAALLREERVPIYFDPDMEIEGVIPPELVRISFNELAETEGICIAVSPQSMGLAEKKNVLWLIPRCLTVGIGCRRGTGAEVIRRRVQLALGHAGIFPESVDQAATIDLKKNEPGLLQYCRENRFPLITYSAEALQAVPGEFTPSEFVRRVAGVDNVCERAAMRAGGELRLHKFAGEAVTVAVACRKEKVIFWER